MRTLASGRFEMTADNCRVEMIGHATLLVRYHGRTLLTDPWLVGPIGCHTCFHFPPLVHNPAELAAQTDAIYISHLHPDHFNRPTLELFSKEIPVYIGDYRRKEFRNEVQKLGFKVFEIPFQQRFKIPGTEFEVSLIEHDSDQGADYDSSIVIRTPEFTVFENNDCFLGPDKYRWVRENFAVDYAFLGYSPAPFFPICFEMEADEKDRLLAQAADRRYNDFLTAAEILHPKLAIPFASGARFLPPAALWKNVSFNSPTEAVSRLKDRGLSGDVMGPGDSIMHDGSIERSAQVLDRDEELRAIERYACEVAEWVADLGTHRAPARADLVDQFRRYVLERWVATQKHQPSVARPVIAYALTGEQSARFYFDFTRPLEQIFAWGEPPRYDMRYTYPDTGLQAVLDGEADWDQLHLMNEVSVHQITFARDYYQMMRLEICAPE